MSRLDGIELQSGDVIYYSKNSDGEITELFLDNVTGDMYKYGIITSAQLNTAGSVKTFTCLADWNSYSYKGATISGVSVKNGGGVGVLLQGNSAVDYITLKQLSAPIEEISGDVIKTRKGDYIIYGNASAFVKSGTSYMQTDLNEVTDLTKYNVTAYYDKEMDEGGRIRVLVAVKKG